MILRMLVSWRDVYDTVHPIALHTFFWSSWESCIEFVEFWWASDVWKVFELLRYVWYSVFPLRCTLILELVGIIINNHKTDDTQHVGEFVRFWWYWWTHSRCTYLKLRETMLRVRGLSMGSWCSEGRWVEEMYMIECTPLRCTPVLEFVEITFKTCAF